MRVVDELPNSVTGSDWIPAKGTLKGYSKAELLAIIDQAECNYRDALVFIRKKLNHIHTMKREAYEAGYEAAKRGEPSRYAKDV